MGDRPECGIQESGILHETGALSKDLKKKSIMRQAGATATKDWKEQVNQSDIESDRFKGAALEDLGRPSKMCSGKRGRISATEHRINLKPDTHHVHQIPYWHGQKCGGHV